MLKLENCSIKKPARDLYAGSSWAAVREVLALNQVNVWIASAGYGLITPSSCISPYSATFTRHHPDFVGGKDLTHGAETWWRKLTERNFRSEKIRSISELVKRYPDTPLIASLSEDYWSALKWDFQKASEYTTAPENLIFIAAGVSERGQLRRHFLPCDARLERQLGRGRSAINVRTLAFALKNYRHLVGTTELFQTFANLLATLDVFPYPKRRHTSDADILNYIKIQLTHQPKMSHSNLLRQLRADGMACEQTRFRNLFQQFNCPR